MVFPVQPARVSAFARACLDALERTGCGRWISIGGAFGLAHYLEYRDTFDVDAWWEPAASDANRTEVVRTLEAALEPFGGVATRSWGEVVSVELDVGGKTVFSFQIARRSAQLDISRPGPWSHVLVDSLDDLIASKMVALIERGAPRDFRDIFMLTRGGLATTARCWDLCRRQTLARENSDKGRAALAIQTHLQRIERARPLSEIETSEDRQAAERVRLYFKGEFLA